MRSNRFLSLAAAAALSLGAAACGGDDDDEGTGPSGSALSAAEVGDAFSALGAAGLFDFGFGFQPAVTAVGLSAQSSTNITIDETSSCPNGGTIKVTGTITANQQTGAFNADIRQAHTNCQAPSETGRVWTFNGNPNLRVQMNFASTGSLTGSMTGGFRYSSNGSSGECSANININVNTSGAGTVTGTMCGQSVNESFDSFED
jgi:hypothetical protein